MSPERATTPETPERQTVPELRSAVADPSKRKAVARLAWIVLAYNLAVILWGAFVRATGSGAGCGRHWPLCNGEVIPRPQSIEMIIEASHRATSGLAVIAVLVLLVVSLVGLPRGHRARRGAAFSTVLIFAEALIGAGLVLFELVAHDASMKRGLSMVLHLCNTFLLLGALALTAWWATTEGAAPTKDVQRPAEDTTSRRSMIVRAVLSCALASVMLLGASGAVAALGDTLFPATSLREGIAQDLSPMAHVFLRLRLFHPVIALGAGVLVLGAAAVVRSAVSSARARSLSRFVTILFVVQFAAGLVNLSLLAPIWMQLLHLLLADATWIALVLMSWEAWTAREGVPAPAPSRPVVAT
jgi:heme A synthase